MKKNFIHRPNCELCASDKKTVLLSLEFTHPAVRSFLDEYYSGGIDKSDLDGGKYEICKCLNCGFVWQTYILNDEFMEKLYSVWILPRQSLDKKRCADSSLFCGYAREVEQISFLFSKKPFEIDILDFGMGWGYWCLMAKAFGYRVSGFEISKERIEFAKKNGVEVIENLSQIARRQFDFINAEAVFEHTPQPLANLKFLVESLKNGGVMRISVPNGKGVEQKLKKNKWRPDKGPIQPLEHINCFTHQMLVKFGKLAHLELMPQPFLSGHRYGLRSHLKGFLGKYYRQYFGTSLYFKKF